MITESSYMIFYKDKISGDCIYLLNKVTGKITYVKDNSYLDGVATKESALNIIANDMMKRDK